MYLDVNKAYSSFDSNLAKNEKNDCFVRALAVATGSAYETAHEKAKSSFGRPDKKGTPNENIVAQMLNYEMNGMTIGDNTYSVSVLGNKDTKNVYKLYGEKVLRQKTLKSFIESHPKGTYIVTVAKHALTVKDGEVMDWNSNKFLPTRKIQGAYKIDSKKVDNQLKLF
jgi:hypothetical protein|tara:strand:- start:321 stop:824 length:504 start_codon:yes stop_codon:yes gene_type:complete